MLFQRINRTDPEKIFIVCYNSYSTASLTNGQVVMWDYTTDCNGVGVTKPTSVASHIGAPVIAGVAAETIAAGSYGLVQVYGYHSSVYMRSATTTGTAPLKVNAIAKGSPLHAPFASNFHFESWSSASNSYLVVPYGFALAAQASYTAKQVAAFLRCL
jgi:hypothetical protein